MATFGRLYCTSGWPWLAIRHAQSGKVGWLTVHTHPFLSATEVAYFVYEWMGHVERGGGGGQGIKLEYKPSQ